MIPDIKDLMNIQFDPDEDQTDEVISLEDAKKLTLKDTKEATSEYLCAYIVSAYYITGDKEIVVAFMKELARRRSEGDLFEFENYIDSELAKLPNFKMDLASMFDLGFKK